MKLLKKYEMFLKYISVAIISFLIDISFFKLFLIIFNNNIIFKLYNSMKILYLNYIIYIK